MVDEFEVSILQTLHDAVETFEEDDLYEHLNKGRENNGLDPIDLALSRDEILRISQEDIDKLKAQIPPKKKKKKPPFNKWFKENFEKDPDHNYWTSIQERQDGMAPGDLSRYYSKEEAKEEWNEL